MILYTIYHISEMEKTVNKKVETHLVEFKNSLKKWLDEKNAHINSSGINITSDFLQFVFDHNGLNFNKEDFQKRKRVKNLVPSNNRCIAKRANGEQCTRHKKGEENLCELSTWRSNNKFLTELIALKSKAGIKVKIVLIIIS